MHYAFVMRILQRVAEMRDDRECVFGCQLASLYHVSQSRTFDVLHQEVVGVGDVAELVQATMLG